MKDKELRADYEKTATRDFDLKTERTKLLNDLDSKLNFNIAKLSL